MGPGGLGVEERQAAVVIVADGLDARRTDSSPIRRHELTQTRNPSVGAIASSCLIGMVAMVKPTGPVELSFPSSSLI